MTTVFGKIISKELPADIVYESDSMIAFKDIAPAAPVHLLIVPKKEIPDLQSLTSEDYPLMGEVVDVAKKLAAQFGVEGGYRLLTNVGASAGQTIFHLHFHLLGGRALGVMG